MLIVFFFFFQLGCREREAMAGQEWTGKRVEEWVCRQEAKVTTEGGKGHTLRQREATSKTMTASHTNHQRAYCSANYCTPQSQENDKNQHWMCLCWGNIRGTLLTFLVSNFSFLSLSFFHLSSLFFLAPSHQTSRLYFLTVNTELYMSSARVRGQLL